MTANEEKESRYFVWEATTRGMGLFYRPAIYHGLPMTGEGVKADMHRFVFCKKLEGEDENKEFITLINENPCPKPPESM